ncbi:MAG: TIGR03960 family B12-binding radical SAM protein [Candidatus Eisenbacteria bacterium]|nr:TIGR03960 family B12-binding radical SAM protein [Candidatus Eisenbacteria bacterium]
MAPTPSSRRLDDILPLVERPVRYLGNELNAVRKNPAAVKVQWLLGLPEVYEIGMSHQGLRILYHILNERADTLAERVFTPWIDMENEMRRAGIELFSLESRRPARDFDLIGLSLQYELTAANVLTMCDLAGIPIWQAERTDGDPIVLGGGPVTSNPEPYAPFFDAILIGDGEEAVHEITDAVAATRGCSRLERLRALAGISGVYVPSLYRQEYDTAGRLQGTVPIDPAAPERVERRFLTELETAPYPVRPVVPTQEIVQDRLAVEVLRGCTQGCRYCQAGYFYRPLRERSPERIFDLTRRGLAATGWDEVGLVSLSTADHTQITAITETLAHELAPDQVGISLPSLRADRFSVGLADKIGQVRKSGFTFAPEAGTESLRLRINKMITDEEFYRAVEAVYAAGWRLIKLYFMIGLPTETDEDVAGIARMIHRVAEIGRSYGGRASVNASIGAFVPKAHTPFQWEAFADRDVLERKLAYLRREAGTRRSRVKFHHVDTSFIEAVHSLGDRRLAGAIHAAWRRGARFDGWTEQFSMTRWEEAFREAGIDPLSYIRSKDPHEPLPWDHIDIHVLKKFLLKERERAQAGQTIADCRHGDCLACGIPGMPDDMRLSPAIETAAAPPVADASRPRSGETAAEAQSLHRLRFTFQKLDEARFIGHLDLSRSLARAFKLVRLPVAHSRGFNPRPRLVLGPPLPVGIEGVCEPADLDLTQPVDAEVLLRANHYLPAGLRITGARSMSSQGPSLFHALERAVYLADLSRLVSSDEDSVPLLDESGLREVLAGFRSSAAWPAVKQGKKGPRTVDLRRAVASLDLVSGGRDVAPEARRISRGPWLRLELRLQEAEGQVANPHLVLTSLFDLDRRQLARIRILRTGFPQPAACASES